MSQIAALVRMTFSIPAAFAMPHAFPHQLNWKKAAHESRVHLSTVPRLPELLTPKTRDPALVDQALGISGLLFKPVSLRIEDRKFHSYGIPVTDRDLSSVRRASGIARESLTTQCSVKNMGAWINIGNMAHHLVAAANAMPAIAQLEGRFYTNKQHDQWSVIVGCTYQALKSMDRRHREGLDLPGELRDQISARLHRHGYNAAEFADFFVQDGKQGDLALDLDFVLNYMAFVGQGLSLDRIETRCRRVANQRRMGGGPGFNNTVIEDGDDGGRAEALARLEGKFGKSVLKLNEKDFRA